MGTRLLLFLYKYRLFQTGVYSHALYLGVINPQRACAAKVQYLVCVCVFALICHLTHWNHKREIATDSSQYGNYFLKGDFCKNISFKSYGIIC